jgi:hypothetical protein
MIREPIIRRAYHFPGFSALVPDIYEGIRFEWIEEIPDFNKEQNGFDPIRIIGNVDLLSENEIPDEFDPPLEFRVPYTFYDERVAGYYTKLKLAYWDGNKWVIISDSAHEFMIFPPSTARFAEVKFTQWPGDPTLAWGK